MVTPCYLTCNPAAGPVSGNLPAICFKALTYLRTLSRKREFLPFRIYLSGSKIGVTAYQDYVKRVSIMQGGEYGQLTEVSRHQG